MAIDIALKKELERRGMFQRVVDLEEATKPKSFLGTLFKKKPTLTFRVGAGLTPEQKKVAEQVVRKPDVIPPPTEIKAPFLPIGFEVPANKEFGEIMEGLIEWPEKTTKSVFYAFSQPNKVPERKATTYQVPTYQEDMQKCIDDGISPLVCLSLTGNQAILDIAIGGQILEAGAKSVLAKLIPKVKEVEIARTAMGLPKKWTQTNRQNAYRATAKIVHPDKATGSTIAFQKLNEANTILKSSKAPTAFEKLAFRGAEKLTKPIGAFTEAEAPFVGVRGLLPERAGFRPTQPFVGRKPAVGGLSLRKVSEKPIGEVKVPAKYEKTWANQEFLAEKVKRGGYVEKTIEMLKKHKVPDDIISELKVEGKYLKDLIKVKREATGEISTTISKNALNYIKKTSKVKDVDKNWVKNLSFDTFKKGLADTAQGYETGARFFKRIGKGYKNLVFDPIRAGERLAVQRAYSLRNVKLKSVFNLSKKEAEELWAYTMKQQGKDIVAPEFKDLNSKIRKAYADIRNTADELYPEVKRVTTKRGREIGEVKNYSPLYTRDDIRILDEGGFNFTRKDPFFGSIKERLPDVPLDLYEKDYRKVMDSWIDGVSRYIDVGERTVGVKYLIDSKEFQQIAGKDVSTKISKWYKHIVSPQKAEGIEKGLRVVRNLQAMGILGFKYTVPLKQFLNLFDFWTMLPARRLMGASLKTLGKSPTAQLARYSGSVQERSLGFAVQDLKNVIVSWARKPAEFTDKLTAKMGRIALVDQQLVRAKKAGIKVTPKMFKNMEKIADDTVDAVMGAMSRAETPAYFRTELGKSINMFYSQLNSKMQFYVTDIFKDAKYAKISGNKAKLLAKAFVSVLVAGYMESTINKLYFQDEPGDITKNALKQIIGNFPIIGSIAFALETGQPYSPSPVLGNITKLMMAIAQGKTEKALWASAGFVGFPQQLEKIITGGRVIKKGGVYDKNGRLLFKVEELPEQIRTIMKGKWGSKAAQEYFEPKDEKEKKYRKESPDFIDINLGELDFGSENLDFSNIKL